VEHAGHRRIADIAIIVALPETVRSRLEKRFRDRMKLRIAGLRLDGRLERTPGHTKQIIEQWAEEAPYDRIVILKLPFAQYPEEVVETLWVLVQLGAIAAENPAEGWPPVQSPFDNGRQIEVINAISDVLDGYAPPPVHAQDPDEKEGDREAEVDVLRGLVTHSMMG
jgi:hypothetical protein